MTKPTPIEASSARERCRGRDYLRGRLYGCVEPNGHDGLCDLLPEPKPTEDSSLDSGVKQGERCPHSPARYQAVDVNGRVLWCWCGAIGNRDGLHARITWREPTRPAPTPGNVLTFIGSRFGHWLVGTGDDDKPMTTRQIRAILKAACERFEAR